MLLLAVLEVWGLVLVLVSEVNKNVCDNEEANQDACPKVRHPEGPEQAVLGF